MTSNVSNPSLLRPLAFCLLGLALLGCGATLSVRGYPDATNMARLAAAVSALWASAGFVAGLALLVLASLLLVPSLWVLRLRLQWRRQRPARVPEDRRGTPVPPASRPCEQDEFEPYAGEEAYEQGPYEEDPDDAGPRAYARGYEPGRRPARPRARFDPRQRVGAGW